MDNLPSAPEMPSVPLKVRIAQMWVEQPVKLILIVVAIILVILGIIFVIIWFAVIEPNQNKAAGPGATHAFELIQNPGEHFLQLRSHY